MNCIILGSIQERLDALISKEGARAKCISCGYNSGRYVDVERHVEARHMNLILPCPFCVKTNPFKTYNSRRTLERHLKQFHVQDKKELLELMRIYC